MKWKFVLATMLVALLLMCWFKTPALVTYMMSGAEASTAAQGQFGDMFGVVNSLFSALAISGLVFTMILQQHEIAIQRQEIFDAAADRIDAKADASTSTSLDIFSSLYPGLLAARDGIRIDIYVPPQNMVMFGRGVYDRSVYGVEAIRLINLTINPGPHKSAHYVFSNVSLQSYIDLFIVLREFVDGLPNSSVKSIADATLIACNGVIASEIKSRQTFFSFIDPAKLKKCIA